MSNCTKSLLGAWPNLPGMGANTKSVPCALLCPLSGAPTPHSPLPGGGGGGGVLGGPQTGSQIHPPLPTLAHGGGVRTLEYIPCPTAVVSGLATNTDTPYNVLPRCIEVFRNKVTTITSCLGQGNQKSRKQKKFSGGEIPESEWSTLSAE